MSQLDTKEPQVSQGTIESATFCQEDETLFDDENLQAKNRLNEGEVIVKRKPFFSSKTHEQFRRYTGNTRFIAGVPAAGLHLASVVLAVCVFIDLVKTTMKYFEGAIELKPLAIEYVMHADFFLLSVALYILSLGLFRLFVTARIPLPKWLEFDTFDDLKQLLISVICVMMGVYFMGEVMRGDYDIDLLWLGLGLASVIVALAFFVKNVFKHEE